MNAEGGDEQIQRRHPKARVARHSRQRGDPLPKPLRRVQKRQRLQPAQQQLALPPGGALEQLKAHRLA